MGGKVIDTTVKGAGPDLHDVLSRGHEYSFAQVMRVARRHFGPGGPGELTGVPWLDRVQIRPELSLAFPAAEVGEVELIGERGDLRITTSFLALYGSASPLPTHYTEQLLDEASVDSSIGRDFLDILHQRLHQLHFHCWGKHRTFLKVAEENSAADADRLFCLIGLAGKALRDSVPAPWPLLANAPVLSKSSRTASGLETLLRNLLGVKELRVEQCVPRTVPIPADRRLRLGEPGSALGVDAVLGSAIADRTGKLRVHVGAVSKAEFDSFLPGTDRHRRLAGLVAFYASPLQCDMRLVMAAGEAQPISLGDEGTAVLGMTAWSLSGETLEEVSETFPLMVVAGAGVETQDTAEEAGGEGAPAALPAYYQGELARLRQLAEACAAAHPAVAPILGAMADPGVERLLEGVALCNARLQQKIDDDLPEFIDEVAERLHPWNLRTIPAMTVVAFSPKAGLEAPLTIPAGAEVDSVPIEGRSCRFRTCYSMTVHPLTLHGAAYSHPPGQAPRIDVSCELKGLSLSRWEVDTLRFFLGADEANACTVYHLLMRSLERVVVTAADGSSLTLPGESVKPVGFEAGEYLLTQEVPLLPGHLLMQEYFLFRDKYLFIDLAGLRECKSLGDGSRFTISFVLAKSPSPPPRLSAKSFVLFASPAINLFKLQSARLEIAPDAWTEKVEPAGKRHGIYEVHSVDAVYELGSNTNVKAPLERPYRITYHGSSLHQTAETSITLLPVSGAFDAPVVIVMDLTCSNAALPGRLGPGDLCVRTATMPEATTVASVRPVTPPMRQSRKQNRQWKLLSHSAVELSTLNSAESLRAVLRDLVVEGSRQLVSVEADLRKIAAIESVDVQTIDVIVEDRVHRGYDYRVSIVSDPFDGPGDLYLFISVLRHLLADHVREDIYLCLSVVSLSELITFPPLRHSH